MVEMVGAVQPRVEILGVGVDRVDAAEALARVQALIRAGRPAQVVTANAELVMHARRDPELAEVVRQAALVVPDGIGLIWAAGLLGDPLPERVPGIELAERLVAESGSAGYSVYFLGAAPGVAEEAAARLRARYPDLQLAGVRHGYFRPEEEPAVLEAIASARPGLLLVGLGMPRQEKWIARHLAQLGVPVAVGVGGSFDVWSGRVRRAPRWMQRLGLEWAYRLARQPRRALRMTALPRFAAAVLAERWWGRRRPAVPGGAP